MVAKELSPVMDIPDGIDALTPRVNQNNLR
jgi:hypothetical protein